MKIHVNSSIRDTVRVSPPQGRHGKISYDMNENHDDLRKEFVDSVLREITPEFLVAG